MFTDTHCHLSIKDYENIDSIVKKANEKGISRMINNGTDLKSNEEVLKLSYIYENVYPAIGFHPDCLDEFKKEDLGIIIENKNKIVAIGEIGLDYHYDGYDKKAQIELFEAQLKLAQEYDLPVIVHSRDATQDTIDTLKKFPNLKGSIHCFSGSLETAKIYIKMGFKLGFGGVTTFKNAKIKEVIKNIPHDYILLETDSPYLSPEPVRGTKNEPANIFYIAEIIAKELEISVEELSKITEENVHDLFDI